MEMMIKKNPPRVNRMEVREFYEPPLPVWDH